MIPVPTSPHEIRQNRESWANAVGQHRGQFARYRLRTGDLFCPVGLLCHLVDPAGWDKDGTHRGERYQATPGVLAVVGIDRTIARIVSTVNGLGIVDREGEKRRYPVQSWELAQIIRELPYVEIAS